MERYRQLILRDINIPEVRWRFRNGDIDLRKPAHQYLWRTTWPSGQYVGRLMQRLTTMHVIPDSLSTLTPRVEFRLRFKDQKFPSRMKIRDFGWRDTEAGEMLPSLALMEAPRMELIPHYKEWWMGRQYTIVMLDLGTSRFKKNSDGRCSGCGE
jgi:large subunit ribosomal protein L35